MKTGRATASAAKEICRCKPPSQRPIADVAKAIAERIPRSCHHTFIGGSAGPAELICMVRRGRRPHGGGDDPRLADFVATEMEDNLTLIQHQNPVAKVHEFRGFG